MKVSTAEFIKNFGTLADKALKEPVTITKHGRDRLVLVEAQEYERLKRRDRRVVSTADMPEEMLRLIMESEMPSGYEHLDEELKGWKP
ncbi:MAG: type II toxin-antitoxin system Phd/YefM family antitoxin [Rhizobiales bacterium]|nr:type II toxin-antitoxin system Phd/YefM family antitoxin [Hyphomicrobiales bacterium]